MPSIVNRHGRTYVADGWALSDAPVYVTNHFELDVPRDSLPDGAAAEYLGSGVYVVHPAARGPSVRARLVRGGDTVTAWTDEAPVPAPRTRKGTETRWRDGKWEKQTRKGWVPA